MVNVEMLNKTIEELDIQSREIQTIIDKEKELQELVNKIQVIQNGISDSSKDLGKIELTLKKYVEASKEVRDSLADKYDSLKELTMRINNKINDDVIDEIIKNKEVITKNIKDLNTSFENITEETLKKLTKAIEVNETKVTTSINESNKKLEENSKTIISTLNKNNEILISEVKLSKSELVELIDKQSCELAKVNEALAKESKIIKIGLGIVGVLVIASIVVNFIK